MKAIILFYSVLLYSLLGQAYTQNLSIQADQIVVEHLRSQGESFQKLEVQNFNLSTEVGAPALPVKTLLFAGHPEELNLEVTRKDSMNLANTRPYPAQTQEWRNQEAAKPEFAYNREAYSVAQPAVTKAYLGQYRGTPVTQVTIAMGSYDQRSNSVNLTTDLEISAAKEPFEMKVPEKKMLIVVPTTLQDSVVDFAQHKEAMGYTVFIESLDTPELTSDGVKQRVADYYANENIGYALFVSDKIPLLRASTSSGTADTDLYYLTMDGGKDYIPDVLGGRIPGSNLQDITDRLTKSMDYEKKTFATQTGTMRVIGIASNEGSNPSDNDYISSIEDSFVQAQNYENVHFYQGNANSTPANLNAELKTGAQWLFYMGHGSGTSWPSMRQTYYVRDIQNITNEQVTKPVIIDVACQNGALRPGYLGTSFSSILTTQAEGATAYLGGTVNISWHPPALMARGIAFEHTKNNYQTLGEAILAGQMYLAANWSSQSDIIDNMEWYVLQGDPSLDIQF